MNKITYAGHSAILLEINNLVVAIDPWLKGNPSCPAHLQDPSKIDLIILSHGHSDHAGDAVRLANQYKCKVVAGFELGNLLVAEGVPAEQIIGMNPGGCINFHDIKVCLTRSFHSSSFETSKNGTQYAGVACGIVVKTEKFCLFHAGDTCIFSDLKLIGEIYRPNVACLPIGDVYTMGAYDGAVAASWLKCERAIPIHYQTFPALTGTAEEFAIACEELGVSSLIMSPGQEVAI